MSPQFLRHRWRFVLLFALLVVLAAARSFAEGPLTTGQTLYVPAYSHIYIGDKEMPFNLTVTLSIRNIDPTYMITVSKVDYYETQGMFLEAMLQEPVVLKPLDSIRYVIPEHDTSGGSGANFIVEWRAEHLVNPPVVETVMIGTRSQQGISFTSRGREIFKHK